MTRNRNHIFFTYIHLVLFTFLCFLSACKTNQKSSSYISLGNEYARDGLLREAVESYKKSIARHPKNLTAFRNLGMVLVKLGNYKDATRYLGKALERYNKNFSTNFYLGEAYRALENYADAIYYYQNSLKIRRNDSHTLKALSWSYFKIRYYSEALTTARKLYKIEPKDSQAAIIIARTLLKLKRYTEALKIVRRAKDDSEKHELPYLHSVEGDITFETGDIQRAKKLYKLAIKGQPLLAGALLGLGKCLYEQKRTKLAITYMERALRIRPLLTETHLLLGKAYEKINLRKSISHYQNFRKKASTDPEYLSLLSDIKKRISLLRRSRKKIRKKRS